MIDQLSLDEDVREAISMQEMFAAEARAGYAIFIQVSLLLQMSYLLHETQRYRAVPKKMWSMFSKYLTYTLYFDMT